MKKILGITCATLFSAVLAFAEGPPATHPPDHDHNDEAAPQSGWALVTPSTKPTIGPVVFETFGTRDGAGGSTTQAGVLPPDLTTKAMLFVDSSGRLSKNLGVAIVNPNDASVTVDLTLKKDDGSIVAKTSSPIDVPSHQQISEFVTQLFAKEASVPSDLTGTLTIESKGGPVAVIGLRFRGSNFSTIPATNLSKPAPVPTITLAGDTIGGDGAVLLPQYAAYGGWASEIVVINPDSTDLKVRVDLFKSDGKALTAKLNGVSASSFKDLKVPAGGVLVLAPRNNDGDDDF